MSRKRPSAIPDIFKEPTPEDWFERTKEALNQEHKFSQQLKDRNRMLRRVLAALIHESKKRMITVSERTFHLTNYEPTISFFINEETQKIEIRVK